MTDPLLKHCPWCKGTDLEISEIEVFEYAVCCERRDCLAIGPNRPTEEQAAEAWNHRPGCSAHEG